MNVASGSAEPRKASDDMKNRDETLEEFEQSLSQRDGRVYVLSLFVSGTSPKSIQALNNIMRICEEYLPGHYALEVVDIYQQPQMAAAEQVIAAPTLVRKLPLPLRKIVGSLSDKKQVLLKLELEEKEEASK